MIITLKKPVGDILQMLDGKKRVAIIGCGQCATICRTGGEQQVEELAETLEKEDKEIVFREVIEVGVCYLPESGKVLERIPDADAVVVLACGSGAQAVLEFNDSLNVFPGVDTKFLGITKEFGEFYRKCALCGDCILHLTGGLCPLALCPKDKVNGPCSDSIDGKCPTLELAGADNIDCVWELIYKRTGKIPEIGRDWSKSSLPEKITLENVAKRKAREG